MCCKRTMAQEDNPVANSEVLHVWSDTAKHPSCFETESVSGRLYNAHGTQDILCSDVSL